MNITNTPGIDHIAPRKWRPYVAGESLQDYAARFPHMGGVKIAAQLSREARCVPSDMCIVEVGTWLGGGTAQLALGASEATPIHCYDRFECRGQDVRKAAAFNVKFKHRGDTLPWVKAALAPFEADIFLHRIELASTHARIDSVLPIGLYVDDASKSADLWHRAMAAFKSRFVPKKTLLFLMDYFFYERAGKKFAGQRDYMHAHADEFTLLDDHVGDTSTAVFLYLGNDA
jgi:hypothetical protein